MTTATTAAPGPSASTTPRGSIFGRLIRSEILKIRSTNIWWIVGLGMLVYLALALLINGVQAHFQIDQMINPSQVIGDGDRRDATGATTLAALLVIQAANIFTSGQFVGLMLVMFMGTVIVTNEYFHQTATTTFLATPKRTQVIVAKFITAIGFGVIAWLITTAINLGVGTLIFQGFHQPTNLGTWAVERAILLNLVAYALWAVIGVGLGVMLRSQIAATLVGVGLYFIGTLLAQAFFNLMYAFVIKQTWVLQAQLAVPAIASQVMVSASPVPLGFDRNNVLILGPQWWVGALILLAWGALFGVLGTLITRKRDIS